MNVTNQIALGILAIAVLGASGSFMYNLFIMTRWATRIEGSQITLNSGFDSIRQEVAKLSENLTGVGKWMSEFEQRMLSTQATHTTLMEVERRVRNIEERVARLETMIQGEIDRSRPR